MSLDDTAYRLADPADRLGDASYGLDGRSFDLVHSTASVVDAAAPTRFRYHEHAGDSGDSGDSGGVLVWGEYAGDTVTAGRFVGRRDGNRLAITFAHVDTAGRLAQGSADSAIDRDEGGLLRLTEHFTANGVAHVSICRESR